MRAWNVGTPGVDFRFEAIRAEEAIAEQAYESLGPAGTATIVGMVRLGQGKVEVDASFTADLEKRIQGRPSCGIETVFDRHGPRLIDFFRARRLKSGTDMISKGGGKLEDVKRGVPRDEKAGRGPRATVLIVRLARFGRFTTKGPIGVGRGRPFFPFLDLLCAQILAVILSCALGGAGRRRAGRHRVSGFPANPRCTCPSATAPASKGIGLVLDEPGARASGGQHLVVHFAGRAWPNLRSARRRKVRAFSLRHAHCQWLR